MPVSLKINGINTPDSMAKALALGFPFIGFVFHPHPSRQIAAVQAGELAREVPTTTTLVGIFADPSDVELEECLAACPVDIIQLHGRESPQRVAEIRQQLNLPIIKTIRLREAADAQRADLYIHDVDYLLYAPSSSPQVRPIGAQDDWAFDWSWLKGAKHRKPWFLSGGIDAATMAQAAAASGAMAFDITAGVEARPGTIALEKLEILHNTGQRLCASLAQP